MLQNGKSKMYKEYAFPVIIIIFGAAVFFSDDFFYTRGVKLYPFVGLLFLVWGAIYLVLILKKKDPGKRK